MSTWGNNQVATLKLKKTDAKTISLPGVNANNSAGTPEQFLAAANRLFAIVGEAAVINGIQRIVTQEAIQE